MAEMTGRLPDEFDPGDGGGGGFGGFGFSIMSFAVAPEIETVILTGTLTLPDGQPARGCVQFTLPNALTFPGADTIAAGTGTAQLDDLGQFRVELIATDATDMQPTGWAYNVVEKLTGWPERRYSILLPQDTPEVDLADVAPADPSAGNYIPVVGPQGDPGVVQSVNGQSVADVVLGADDVGAVPAADVGAPDGVAALDGTGVVPLAQVPDIPASKITSGTLDAARVPGLDAAKVTSGTFDTARIPNLDAAKVASGTLDVARVPSLPASQITSGTLAAARIPSLPASQITSGTLDTARIPSLPASQITSGVFDAARIPELGGWTAADSGFLAWTFDPALASAFGGYSGTTPAVPGDGQLPAVGRVYVMAVKLHQAATISRVHFYAIGFAGTPLTSGQCFAGLYNASGTQVGVTASIHASWAAYSNAFSLSSPYSAAAGVYYIALVLNGTQANFPVLARGASYGVQPAGNARYGSGPVRFGAPVASGATSLPGSFTVGSLVPDSNAIWAAVS